jgi:hypothetical protein
MEEVIKDLYPAAAKLVSGGQYDHCYYFITHDGQTYSDLDKIKIARKIVQRDDASWDVLDLLDKIHEMIAFIYKCNNLPSSSNDKSD